MRSQPCGAARSGDTHAAPRAQHSKSAGCCDTSVLPVVSEHGRPPLGEGGARTWPSASAAGSALPWPPAVSAAPQPWQPAHSAHKPSRRGASASGARWGGPTLEHSSGGWPPRSSGSSRQTMGPPGPGQGKVRAHRAGWPLRQQRCPPTACPAPPCSPPARVPQPVVASAAAGG